MSCGQHWCVCATQARGTYRGVCVSSKYTLRPEYSEKALYNQLSFYRFIFDWDYAFNKVLTPEDRAIAKGRWALERQAYKKLKDVVDRALASSSYSEVNLAKLFQAFTALK
ncbi:hypothetical protein AALO_G00208240 [Alosa alosa]|uniref:Zinc finger DNA-directed DNA polymerase family B alpha domain-containing protein n=1 Tax=Alosa alosa TaxID=278164 RepID=A0AAV6FZ28_9TELE|nr:hypothetical protein AALO_G00208240 [Alosa alosa]